MHINNIAYYFNPGTDECGNTKQLGASEITANLYYNCVHLYWEGCVFCSTYLR